LDHPVNAFNAPSSKGHDDLFDGASTQMDPSIISQDRLNAYFIMNLRKRIKYFNKAFKTLLHYTKNDFYHLTGMDIIPEGQHHIINHYIQEFLMKRGRTPIFRCEYITKKGKTVYVDQCFFLVRNKYGAFTDICVSMKDVSVQKRCELRIEKLKRDIQKEKQKLEETLSIDRKMSSIFELHHLIDFIVEKTSKILNARRCSLMIYDSTNKELLIKGAKGIDADVIKDTRVKIGAQFCGSVAKKRRAILVQDIETDKRYLKSKNKGYDTKSFMIAPIIAHDNLLGVVNVSEKETSGNMRETFNEFDLKIFSSIVNQAAVMIENANYYREMEYLSTTDSLSNIFNHRFFVKYLNDEIKRIQRYKGPLSIIMIDIDNFMNFNQVYGKSEGDSYIQSLGKLLKNNVREVDVVCRYAGDEFVIVLPETSVSQAQYVALKLLSLIKHLKVNREIAVSIGVTGFKEGMKSSDVILKVYQALRNAKRQHRSKVYCLK
jgi:diguanylate cyclase (GGDEF)-like protein/PAS domain S-box-containing protein